MGKYITNKWDKKAEVEAGAWVAAWSDDISETDAINGVVAAGVSIYTANPAAFIEWVTALIERTIDSLISSAQREFPDAILGQVKDLAVEIIKSAVDGRDAKETLKQFDTVDFKAGAIRYSGRNYEWNVFAQRYDPIGPPTWGLKPYVAFRWRGSVVPDANLPPNPPGGPPNPPAIVHPPENPALGVLKVRIANGTSLKLRIKSMRFSNQEPVVYSVDLNPDQHVVVDYIGGSTRVFAAWKISNGQLVFTAPIDIFANTAVVIRELGGGVQVAPSVEIFDP